VRPLRTLLIFWLPLIAWFLVIHNFSATPSKDLPYLRIPHGDKIFHAAIYFILGVLLIRAFDHSTRLVIDKSNFNVGLAKMVFLAIIIYKGDLEKSQNEKKTIKKSNINI
jgi:VanZ family protein